MQLREPVRAKRSIGLTPLIDVVFLLLVFFMLASTFLKFGTVALETAGAGAAIAEPSEVILVHVGGARGYRVNGRSTKSEELTGVVNQLIDQGARDAIIVLRSRAAVDDLVDAVRKLRQGRAASVRIVE